MGGASKFFSTMVTYPTQVKHSLHNVMIPQDCWLGRLPWLDFGWILDLFHAFFFFAPLPLPLALGGREQRCAVGPGLTAPMLPSVLTAPALHSIQAARRCSFSFRFFFWRAFYLSAARVVGADGSFCCHDCVVRITTNNSRLGARCLSRLWIV